MNPLFQPYQIGQLKLPNRWVMAPMTREMAPGGIPTELTSEYYLRRAQGGVGLIITEGVLIDHPQATDGTDIPYLRDDTVEAWRRVTDTVHTTESKIFCQIWHRGPDIEGGIGAVEVKYEGKVSVHRATEPDLEVLLQAYANAAALIKSAGFDGVEIHAAHGYLLDSFLRHNRRDFVHSVVRSYRSILGPDFPIALRFSNGSVLDYDEAYFTTHEELEALLLPLKAAGVSIFHPSEHRFWETKVQGKRSLASWTREITGLPTMMVGSICRTVEDFCSDGPSGYQALKKRFDLGDFDMPVVGRALLSDPDWVNKVRTEDLNSIIPFTESAKQTYP